MIAIAWALIVTIAAATCLAKQPSECPFSRLVFSEVPEPYIVINLTTRTADIHLGIGIVPTLHASWDVAACDSRDDSCAVGCP